MQTQTIVDELSPYQCRCGRLLRLLVARTDRAPVFGGLVCCECLRLPDACTCDGLPGSSRPLLVVPENDA